MTLNEQLRDAAYLKQIRELSAALAASAEGWRQARVALTNTLENSDKLTAELAAAQAQVDALMKENLELQAALARQISGRGTRA